MKKSLYFLMALAALAMSCNKVEEPKAPVEPVVEEGVPFSFCAGFVSKTVNDGLSTKWVAGDQVSLFNAAAGEAFAANGAFSIAEADLADNKFTGLLAAELTADAYDWAAVYPYAEANTSLAALALEIGAPAVTVAADAKTLLAGETLPLSGTTAGVAKDEAVAIQRSH
ncbi:MAG: hypothetical protein MJY56_04940, partial [Bacteroidales bacterium]|nr:hypothetical protein [Bacteroidales bacterium]